MFICIYVQSIYFGFLSIFYWNGLLLFEYSISLSLIILCIIRAMCLDPFLRECSCRKKRGSGISLETTLNERE